MNTSGMNTIPTLTDLLNIKRDLAAVCFDMDGTLLDSEPLHANAVWRMLPVKPVVVGDSTFVNEEDLNHHFCGQSDADVFSALKPGQPTWKSWQLKNFSDQKNKNLIVEQNSSERLPALKKSLRPQMAGLLKELKEAGIPCALVSASQKEVVDDFVSALDLKSYFQTWIGAEALTLTKPHPDPYLKACRDIGVNPQDSLALEDSLTGMKSARAAGLSVIQARWFSEP